ncbi:hypothetical protein PHYPSEUDO_004147 [Phytophthora pseudosyringae]|uniref:Uncharacterized protein n=1 Tax=Phytophthora pseudosyringae TaxID=221518 RepID=A0A8T1WEK2_9STRA|nr:hypothetical protein PHYPSEUDO_004147 [Phytophthora pseudosyringae]
MEAFSPCSSCVVDAPPQRFPMPPTAPSSLCETAPSPPVDLEMLSEALIFQGVELASEFKDYAVDAAQSLRSRYSQVEGVQEALLDAGSRLWRWLQQKLRAEEADATKELLPPLPQPAVLPVRLQHMDYITECFDNVKTQLQLIYAAVDDLQTKGEQTHRKLDRLQKQLRRVPAWRCEPQERCARCSLTTAASSDSNTKANGQSARISSETPMLHVERLEVPMEVVQPPTTLYEHSSAVLYWIIEAVDGGSPISQDDEDQCFLRPIANQTPSATSAPNETKESLANNVQDSAEQVGVEEQDGTNADQLSSTIFLRDNLEGFNNLRATLNGRLSDAHESVTERLEPQNRMENDQLDSTTHMTSTVSVPPTDDGAFMQVQEQHDTEANQLNIFQLYQVTARENE